MSMRTSTEVRKRRSASSPRSVSLFPDRVSRSTKTTSRTTPTASGPQVVGAAQVRSALISPQVSREKPDAEITICARGSGRSPALARPPGTKTRHRPRTRTATTMSSQNTARHPQRSIMGPPTRGPNGAPTAPAAVQIAVATAHLPDGKSRGMSASDMGVKTDAASPMTTRAASSTITVFATAARTAPAMNATIPPSRRRRCPNRSPSAPPSSSTDKDARL